MEAAVDAPVIGAAAPARPSISLPPQTVIGYRADGRPIRVIAGGAQDDDNDIEVDDAGEDTDLDETDESDADTDEDDDEEEPAAKVTPKPGPRKTAAVKPAPAAPAADSDWTPPSREDHERMKRTLAARKTEKLDLQRQLNEERAKNAAAETETEKAIREAAEAGERRFKEPLVRTAARAALIQAGALASTEGDKEKGEAKLRRLLKLVDMNDVSVDSDTGEVLGLDEQVEAMQADYPELFKAPVTEQPKLKPRPTAAAKKPAPDKPKSTWERHAAAVLKS
jgi:hypothetical protein